MTKTPATVPPEPDGPRPLPATRGRWLLRKILALFQEWEVRPGERAPVQVEVADEFGIWHTRVSAAYRRLRASGYLTGGGVNNPYWVVAVEEVFAMEEAPRVVAALRKYTAEEAEAVLGRLGFKALESYPGLTGALWRVEHLACGRAVRVPLVRLGRAVGSGCRYCARQRPKTASRRAPRPRA